jgi:hypothetical protein
MQSALINAVFSDMVLVSKRETWQCCCSGKTVHCVRAVCMLAVNRAKDSLYFER